MKKPATKAPRRKKMYSDFVGVTYNKTHAKYQACITHYRKQHYLGRYKLAVDAARAYDQSAKLLKGDSWKINFQTDQDYEIAKAKEMEMIERRRHEAEMKNGGCGGNVNSRSQYDSTSRMVKEKLGLRVPLSQDPSVVAEKMLKDRLSAVAKQAADHADQLKMNGMDFSKKAKNNALASLKKNEATKTESDSKAAKSAVTPSPHQSQSTNKQQSMLINQALMSPPFMGNKSPTVESLLAQQSPSFQTSQGASDKSNTGASATPSSLNAIATMVPPSAKAVQDSNLKQLGESMKQEESSPKRTVNTSGIFFSSPNPEMKTLHQSPRLEQKGEDNVKEGETASSTGNDGRKGDSPSKPESKVEKTDGIDQTEGNEKSKSGGGSGALAAASALLSITRM